MEVTIGELIDRKYRIVRLLGEGGMGAVYEGENVRIHHRVAIKVLHSGIATNSAAVERFEREAQAAGKIGSDHIVEVFDLGELPGGARYMVMEYLDGENLSSRIRSTGRMAPQAIAPIMLQLLEGLGAAHTAGIVHRDLKPDNVFLVRSKSGGDFVKIVDFGVSKFNNLSGDSAMSMTRTGAVIGTPYYMSPEQARGAKGCDHRADLYSAGVVLYECATGRVPFLADTFNELMFKIVLEPPPDPVQLVEGLDPRFAAIIMKAMAREVDARFQSAQEFSRAVIDWMASLGLSTSAPGLATTTSNPSLAQPHAALMATQSALATTASPNPSSPMAASGGKLSMTSGSIPNVAMAEAPPEKKGGGLGPSIAVAAVVVLVGGGIAAMKFAGSKASSTSAEASTTAQITAAPAAPPAAAAQPPAAAQPVEPTAAAATASAAPSAAPAHAIFVPATSRVKEPREAKPAAAAHAAAPAAAPAASSATDQVKGRTIRTGL